MHKIRGFVLIVVLIFLMPTHSYAQQQDIKKGVVESKGQMSQYVIGLSEGESAKLARDGGLAVKVNNQEVIKKPGTYFLTYQKQDGTFKIIHFSIPYKTLQKSYKVNSKEELGETLKQVLNECATEVTLEFGYGNLKFNELFNHIDGVMNSLVSQYPVLYYNSYEGSGYGGKNAKLTLKISYSDTNQNQVKMKQQQAMTKLKQILESTLTKEMTTLEKELAIVEELIQHITYPEDTNPMIQHTLQGSVVDGIAVCDGYARTLMYLLNSCGIPTSMVYGKAGGEEHAWNVVNIEGKKYHVDLTWADQDTQHVGGVYDYINETSEYMSETHVWYTALPDITKDLTYSNVRLPYNEAGIYSVSNHDEWNKIQEQIKADNLCESSLIFYNKSSNKWNKDLIIEKVLQKERAGSISYLLNEKYDTLILSYKVK